MNTGGRSIGTGDGGGLLVQRFEDRPIGDSGVEGESVSLWRRMNGEQFRTRPSLVARASQATVRSESIEGKGATMKGPMACSEGWVCDWNTTGRGGGRHPRSGVILPSDTAASRQQHNRQLEHQATRSSTHRGRMGGLAASKQNPRAVVAPFHHSIHPPLSSPPRRTSFTLQAAAVLLPLDAHEEIPSASAKLRVPELLPGLRVFARRRTHSYRRAALSRRRPCGRPRS